MHYQNKCIKIIFKTFHNPYMDNLQHYTT